VTWIGIVVGIALTIFVFLWFEPHKAFINERVDETIPTATPTTVDLPTTTPPTTIATGTGDTSVTTEAPSSTTTIPAVAYPIVLSESTFENVAHGGSGTVLVLELEDGSRVVRFEDLDIDNGPDLVVILSDRQVTGANDYADGEWLNIGDLKGNQGNQNYELPSDVDLGEWSSVAIWCRRFNTTFNAASLVATG